VIDTSRFVFGDVRHILGGFLIVAMFMVDPFVAQVILPAQGGWDGVVDLQQVSILEVESAPWALPLLYLEQLCLFVVHERVLFQPSCPIQQVSIIRACSPSYLHIVLSVRFRMEPDIDWFRVSRFVLDIRSKPDPCAHSNAVFPAYPPLAFSTVSGIHPSYELSIGIVIAGQKDPRTRHPSVVDAPSPYDGIEVADDLLLWSVSQLPQPLSDFSCMAFDGLFTWAYDRPVSQWLSACVFSRVRFPHTVLPHVKAQKIKSHVSLTGVQRVGNPGFTRTQLQAHAL
jgi:hypothetical protein